MSTHESSARRSLHGVGDPSIRFAVGRPDNPRSAAWKLWVHGSDAYLTARTVGGLLKLSMHASGEWISAFTSESGVYLDKTGSRRHSTWHRPAEFAPGWTHGPVVDVPWVSWRDDLRPKESFPSDVVWFPEPKRNKKVMFNVLFAAGGNDDDAAAVSQPGDRILASLSMSNGETVWLQARQAVMTPDENRGLASAEREFRGFEVGGSLKDVHAWGLWITTAAEIAIPLLVQFPLGRRHFKEAPSGAGGASSPRRVP